jgi:hypothetical protein
MMYIIGIIIYLIKLNLICNKIQMANDKSESQTTIKGIDKSNWNDWSCVRVKS